MTWGVKAFFIIGKGPHSAYAEAILRNIDGICRCVHEQDEPFVAKVFQSRVEVQVWVTYSQWKAAR